MITVGVLGADDEPTVAIDGVTITHGVTTSSPGLPHEPEAVGGGVWVPPSQNLGTGATLRLTRSVITGNRAVPASSIPGASPAGRVGNASTRTRGVEDWTAGAT